MGKPSADANGHAMSKLTSEQREKLKLLDTRRKYHAALASAFAAEDIHSRETPVQLAARQSPKRIKYIIAGNRSGKTTFGGKEVSDWFMNRHPYHARPAKWGVGPISIIVMGQTNDSIDKEIWEKKLKPFLGEEDVDYKLQRVATYPKSVTNLRNGNTILFLTHSDAEQARRRAQSFTAHVAWIDEMPPLSQILTEMRLRVLTTDGFLYCTFTPLFTNDKIRKIVDSKDPKAEKFIFSILENPALSEEDRAAIVEEFRNMSGSESEFKARLYGEWMAAGQRVYAYDSDNNYCELEGYEPHVWPHVVIVDPAASGLAGLLVMAREPERDSWYAIKAKYIKGAAFSELVQTVESEVQGFNILKRICDCTPSAYYLEAAKQGIAYMPISEKADNKENWIEGVNKAFTGAWLWMTGGSDDLNNELISCARKEDDPTKIIKASKYHISDCLRYFVVFKPKFELPEKFTENPAERFRREVKKAQAAASRAREQVAKKAQAAMIRRSRRFRG